MFISRLKPTEQVALIITRDLIRSWSLTALAQSPRYGDISVQQVNGESFPTCKTAGLFYVDEATYRFQFDEIVVPEVGGTSALTGCFGCRIYRWLPAAEMGIDFSTVLYHLTPEGHCKSVRIVPDERDTRPESERLRVSLLRLRALVVRDTHGKQQYVEPARLTLGERDEILLAMPEGIVRDTMQALLDKHGNQPTTLHELRDEISMSSKDYWNFRPRVRGAFLKSGLWKKYALVCSSYHRSEELQLWRIRPYSI